MASIKEKMQEDLKVAMKAREQEKVLGLRQLMSEIKRVEIDTRKELSDGDVSAILQKEVKKRKDALEFAEAAKREDIVSQNKRELALIQAYLGEQYSEEKLKQVITELVSTGADSLGKVMGGLNKDHKGKFDGKLASEIAKSFFG